jgi:hypothetical protein
MRPEKRPTIRAENDQAIRWVLLAITVFVIFEGDTKWNIRHISRKANDEHKSLVQEIPESSTGIQTLRAPSTCCTALHVETRKVGLWIAIPAQRHDQQQSATILPVKQGRDLDETVY